MRQSIKYRSSRLGNPQIRKNNPAKSLNRTTTMVKERQVLNIEAKVGWYYTLIQKGESTELPVCKDKIVRQRI